MQIKYYIIHTPYQLIACLNIITGDSSDNKHILLLVQKKLEDYISIINKIGVRNALLLSDFCISYNSSSPFEAHIKMMKNIVRLKSKAGKTNILQKHVDELYIPSDDIVCRVIYYQLKRINNALSLSLFDDGTGTYSLYTFKNVSCIGNIVYKCFLNSHYADNIKKLYCYQPKLMARNIEEVQYIRIISNELVRSQFKSIVDESVIDKYRGKKVVFLDQGLSEIKEVKESLAIIRKYFKKDEVLVKLHPRIVGATEYDYETSRDGCPFEILLSVLDFSGCILVSHSSGGIINSLLMFGENSGLVVYLLKMTNDESSNRYIDFFERVQKKYGPGSLYMPQSVTELNDFFKKNREIEGVKDYQ